MLLKSKTQKIRTGTREWAEKNVNIYKGCYNNCKYCYARPAAVCRRRDKTFENWSSEELNPKTFCKKIPKNKRVMFPSTHDITENTVDNYIIQLNMLLQRRNTVLIVSKPRIECIQKICRSLEQYKNSCIFRFTIGTMDNEILRWWEPNAPVYNERKAALMYAYNNGWKTSISCEPRLNNDTEHLYADLIPYVTDTFWIGTMNRVMAKYFNEEEKDKLKTVKSLQTKDKIIEMYHQMRALPKIEWKDSIKKILSKEGLSY